ncbi:hypothetical protein [Paraburkholderia sp. 22B1P]|jgi:putative transposase|uniref:hypothetical protein n=1 Tax=Paraburkholderia sp. 22B1P TaxID=3080498 RepID=UPI003084A6CA|nr:hypothetical protein PBP221_76840 [Paraburkholderia sp. 22B1P]
MPAKSHKFYRCDVLPSPMNGGKHARVLALLRAWRRVAVLHGREQWRLFYQRGALDARLRSRTGYDQVGTVFGQMIRKQVVGALDSFLSPSRASPANLAARSRNPGSSSTE